MPPIRRYWFAYLLTGLASLILVSIGIFLFATTKPENPQPFVVYAAGWIALFTLVGSTWSQWKTSTIQHAMQALQTLRTDKEYLINAGRVVPYLRRSTPVDDEQMAAIKADQQAPYMVAQPNDGQAVYFVLNQYEFIAAAAHAGALDKNLLRQTIRGVVVQLVSVFAPLIAEHRRANPSALRNLVKLYRLFSDTSWPAKPDLGPEFPWDPRLKPAPWLGRRQARTRAGLLRRLRHPRVLR